MLIAYRGLTLGLGGQASVVWWGVGLGEAGDVFKAGDGGSGPIVARLRRLRLRRLLLEGEQVGLLLTQLPLQTLCFALLLQLFPLELLG